MADIFDLYARDEPPVNEIACDDTSGLPLLSQVDGILRLIHSYLPLPYSVVEFGCGQKAGIVLRMLGLHHGVPPHALQRGLVIERDLGPAMLDETDAAHRPHALTAPNTLAERVEVDDPAFRRFVEDSEEVTRVERDRLVGPDLELRLDEQVQFVRARSHVFVVVTFWDERHSRPAPRVVDLTLCRDRLFEVGEMRDLLSAPEAWIFLAPLMGRFRLDGDHLTGKQRADVGMALETGETLEELSGDRHARLFRQLSGAPEGSLGDPATWTSSNNIYIERDSATDRTLRRETGRGDDARQWTRELIEARVRGDDAEARSLRRRLLDLARELDLRRVLQEEGLRCEEELQPLAAVANTLSLFHSLRALSRMLANGDLLLDEPPGPEVLRQLHGIGVRLRRRIEIAATISRDEEGQIDARALNDRYFRIAAETIRQMNRVGLTVYIDRVGNLHGLSLDENEREALREGKRNLASFCREALCLGSHLDTVADAGKYDGRLGVFSGIEVAAILGNLRRHFSSPLGNTACARLMVSVFSAEEMTFTGQGVSLPGSAAVAGQADVKRILAMTNGAGERYGERLNSMGRFLLGERKTGAIDFQGLSGDAEEGGPFAHAPEPAAFFPGMYWERHIEQGLVLHRRGVPLTLTRSIVGIRHEDWHLTGRFAEEAGWALVGRARELLERGVFSQARLTCGIFEPGKPDRNSSAPGRRWRIEGASDHAGTTALQDRRDAGVAAARLVRHFTRELESRGRSGREVRPVVAGSVLLPGRNRNVIPPVAEVTLGCSGDLGEGDWQAINRSLETFAAEVLTQPVEDGGEGVEVIVLDDEVDLHPADTVRVSTDLRHEDPVVLEKLREAIAGIARDLNGEFGTGCRSEVHQSHPPVSLEEAGIVLQMERSYGGSHNPKETELATDVLRGLLFQFAMVREVLAAKDDRSLYRRALRALPEGWCEKPFISGALHDSANLALGMSEGRGPTRGCPPAGGR